MMSLDMKNINNMAERYNIKYNIPSKFDTVNFLLRLKHDTLHYKNRIKIIKVLQYRWPEETIDSIILQVMESINLGAIVTHQKLILMYGKKEGNKRWESYKNKQKITNSFEYKQKHHNMTKAEFDEYNASRAVTLNNMIFKYGEVEGHNKFEIYKEKQKYAGCSLEYFIDIYGNDDGLLKYNEVCKSKGHTLENYINKYGEKDGYDKFIEYNKNIQSSNSYSSKLANTFFDTLNSKLGNLEIYSSKTKEFGLYCNISKKYYFYDFKIKGTNKIIEYNGDYWHANPKLYFINQEIKFPNNVIAFAHDIWEADKYKIDLASRLGYNVYTVWEYDIRQNEEKEINNAITWLNK